MKKLLIILCLMMAEASAYAQKEYVIVHNYGYELRLGGKIPNEVEPKYAIYSSEKSYIEKGDLLNLLAEKGFELIFVDGKDYILSRKTSGGQASTRLETIKYCDDEVTEVARYNLQGLPVTESDKGIQIIVYSNYTTKTIIVQ